MNDIRSKMTDMIRTARSVEISRERDVKDAQRLLDQARTRRATLEEVAELLSAEEKTP